MLTQGVQQAIRFGPYEADFHRGELRKFGTRIKIQSKPLAVLALLVQTPGQTVLREEFRAALWPDDVFVDFDKNLATAVNKLRQALCDTAEHPQYIETVPRVGYRFLAAVEPIPATGLQPVEAAVPVPTRITNKPSQWTSARIAAAICIAALLVIGIVSVMSEREARAAHPLTEKDTVVVVDFTNKTGDAVFDDALKQAFAVELGQSPFLAVLSDRKVSQSLRLMGRAPNQPLTMDVGRDLCQRTGSKAVLGGTISKLGNDYLIELTAIACTTGDTLAEAQGEASSKEDVLRVLNQASSNLRTKLGESLPSVQKFDVPVEATTSSLEALQNYSLSMSVEREKGEADSIPFLKRAIELDPNFALAYAALGRRYNNLGQPSQGLEYAAKAYQLRNSVSERERLRITVDDFSALGDIDGTTQAYEVWAANYPRDPVPHNNLAMNYGMQGQFDKAASELQQALRLAPDNVIIYGNLGLVYLYAGRFDQAKATFDQALAQNLDSGGLRGNIYSLAFLEHDDQLMQQQIEHVTGKPGDEDPLLSAQSDTEAYYGRMNAARDFSRRAVDSAVRADSKEAAALWQVNAALREAELGDASLARQGVTAALALSPGRDVKVFAALTLARIGDIRHAEALAQGLAHDYPSNTMLKLYWLPSIHAAIDLSKGDASQALTDLQPAAPYEFGVPPPLQLGTIYPAYLRGQAYLAAHDRGSAVKEFQKILQQPGIVQNFLTGSLAQLQIARAYSLAGDAASAKAAYEKFLQLWQHADPDLATYSSAKAEYAHLQHP